MNRIQLACYGLLASAFILSSLCLFQASRIADNRAHAEMVVNKGFVTMVSTAYRTDSEIIYVLDSKSEMLAAYMLEPNKKVIELMPGGVVNLGRAFEMLGNAAAGGGKRPR
jgi:predicted methyltransferase